jgi:hypothetical protein
MKAEDVTVTLEMALDASGIDKANVLHRRAVVGQRLLLRFGRSSEMDEAPQHGSCSSRPLSPDDTGQDRALASDAKDRILLENYYMPGDLENQIEAFRGRIQQPSLSWEHRQPHSRRCPLRTRPNHPAGTRKDQTQDYPSQTIATPPKSCLASNSDEPEPLIDQAASCLTTYSMSCRHSREPERCLR